MKRFFRTVALVLVSGALFVATADAQTRTGVRSNMPTQQRQKVTQQAAKPANTGRPGNSGLGTPTTRPAVTPSQPSTGRPGNSGQGNNQGMPPGNSRPQTPPSRPGNSPGMSPGGAPGGPIGGQRPNYRPQNPPPPGRPGAGPVRPNMPPAPAWYRPTPPPAWRPPSAWRAFTSILGVALGTSINLSINSLINSGYTVSQYGNNTVYVNNVPMLNMMWPDAILYYNSMGGLCGLRFVYPSTYYDMTRYNSVYASLVRTYGAPYSVQNTGSGIEANWWGTGNQFITLSFAPQYNSIGQMLYYTTLSFGN